MAKVHKTMRVDTEILERIEALKKTAPTEVQPSLTLSFLANEGAKKELDRLEKLYGKK
jgi:hypothetical protein